MIISELMALPLLEMSLLFQHIPKLFVVISDPQCEQYLASPR